MQGTNVCAFIWRRASWWGLCLLVAGLLAGCDTVDDTLPPYQGNRPLDILRVTQSFTPDVQWVGGRVAVVGVNRGTQAALDETLVWATVAGDNTINSHVTIGEGGDDAFVTQHGGTPVTQLQDGETYTVWMAERDVLDAGLSGSARNAHTYADTTVTMGLILRGNARGGEEVDLRIVRDERLSGSVFRIEWEEGVEFRQLAIRRGAGTPGFTGLVWHVVTPDDAPDGFTSPVIIGEAPPGTDEAIAWPESGFERDTYTLWMTNAAWTGSFALRAQGLAYFQIFSNNFEDE